MAKRGRPPLPHPRRHGVFVRFSDTERGALEQALRTEHPVSTRRPTLPEWLRDLVVAHAGQILGVDVTRATLPAASQTGNDGGSLVPSAAPPLAVANAASQPVHDLTHILAGTEGEIPGEIPLGFPLNRKTISLTQEGNRENKTQVLHRPRKRGSSSMDTSVIAFWLTLVGTACWPACFWWMYRISTKQNSLLDELREQGKRIERLSKAEHDLIKDVHPQVSEIKEGMDQMIATAKENSENDPPASKNKKLR